MTGEQFMKRASVVIIGASIVLAVWWKTEPAAEREKRGVILPTEATAEEFTHEQEAGEKAVPDRPSEVLEGHVAVDDRGSLDEGCFPAIPEKEKISESSAGEEDPGAGAETEAAFVPAPDVPAAPASAPVETAVETAAAGVQVGAEIVLVRIAVDGVVLSPYLQEYLYGQLARYGCEWFFPVALCQIYQESRFRSDAVNPNGMDKGLCQFREQYWEYHAKLSGLYEYDIWNPIDQLWVYAWLMSENLRKSSGDVGMALSRYYLGEATYCEKYVGDVMQWIQTMEVR